MHITSSSPVLLMLSPLGWAAGSLLVRRVDLPAGPMADAAQMIAGSALASLYGYGSGERIAAVPSTRALLTFVYLVLFGSIVIAPIKPRPTLAPASVHAACAPRAP